MNQPKISVIVPVYKAEAYLETCVKSIREQTYQNLEIILIDDGSPDRCGQLCDQFAAEDPRIRVIHKENGGQSAARNMGLDIATGDYIGFVDADDWIEPTMYETLYQLLQQHGAQISACGARLIFEDGNTAYLNNRYPADSSIRVFSTLEALENVISNKQLTNSLWDKLYKKQIFEGLRLTVGKIYEDMELIPKGLEKAQKVVYDPTPCYQYRQTATSTIRGEFTPARFAEADVALAIAEDYKVRYPALYPRALACYISVSLVIVHRSRKAVACKQLRQDLIRSLKKPIPKAAFRLLRRVTKLKFIAFKLGVPVYEAMMWVIDRIKRQK